MLNEDRIKVMTNLAIQEEKNGRSTEQTGRFYRRDYVSYHMIWTAITSTMAFLLILTMGILYKLEFFLNGIHKLNLSGIGKIILLIYFIYIIAFEVFAYYFYNKKYKESKKRLKKYCGTLHELERIYNQEKTTAGYLAGGPMDYDSFT